MTQAMSDGAAQTMFAADQASRALGITLLEARDGAAKLRMTVTAEMVNGHGTAHGGYLFLFADTAFACACNSHGPVTVAAGADISFVRPAREGDTLTALAEERTTYGRSGIYDVTVLRESGPDGRPGGDGHRDGDGASGGEVIAEFRGRSRTVGRVEGSP
ncbi:hydroxyphenylacetyl-CoA thioesterase PaaI [Streptomyces sp. HNM0575]|uniref:hydroxyphenylacetyl-CoA thioesterase PaaI n=1 Tax=Streptomyces sp. HNM0575 TaxID=2716338 RepID=UPI00145FBE3E|nr:hydroxyphenylacetyl-CoA thioesterase PaaI [Streptomyces sp. HNM0575]NLU73105.1 hydroxyphenylacetyl-CoA thioesterase PaaI [Streptomyces sp. HNM0575]